MKHSLFLFLFLCCLPLHAQKIIIDKTQGNTRHIATNTKICRDFTDKAVFAFGLSYITDNDHQSWQLVTDITTNDPQTVQAGDEILIRSASGTVHHLTANLDAMSHLQSNSMGMTSYTITIMADITTEQLDDLCNGILKIRAIGIDKEYKKDKAGKTLSKCRQIITEHASKPNDF